MAPHHRYINSYITSPSGDLLSSSIQIISLSSAFHLSFIALLTLVTPISRYTCLTYTQRFLGFGLASGILAAGNSSSGPAVYETPNLGSPRVDCGCRSNLTCVQDNMTSDHLAPPLGSISTVRLTARFRLQPCGPTDALCGHQTIVQ